MCIRDRYKSFDEASKKFNNLEKSFNERSDSLGNYGLGVSAVSYTHLDVYKRQTYGWTYTIIGYFIKS